MEYIVLQGGLGRLPLDKVLRGDLVHDLGVPQVGQVGFFQSGCADV